MAGLDDGDSFFGDDDLDALPEDTLQDLEYNAIQFTQAQTQARIQPAPSSDYGDEFDDEDLDDAVVIDQSRTAPLIPLYRNRNTSGLPTQRDQRRPQQYPTPSPVLPNRQHPNPPPQFNEPSRYQPQQIVRQNNVFREEQGSAPLPQPNSEVERLQSIIEELTKERNSLKNDVNSKAGEISIVRTKHETTIKEYEREMAAQRKLGEDKLAKQQKALEAARIAEENAATERDFIKRDLAEETELVRKLNKARDTGKKGLDVVTPKKKKANPLRDGFDDDEIEIISPSKLSPSKFQKRNVGSPSKPGKRKRKAVESPAGALQVIHSEESTESIQQAPMLDEALIARLGIQDDRFDFLGMMLDHRVNGNGVRTFEELGKHAHPSAPDESFQAIILGKIPSLGFKKTSKDLEVDFCQLLVTMWANCVEESHYAPVYLLIDMLTFALELSAYAIAPNIIDSLVLVAQLTADRVAIKRFQKCRDPLEKYIDVTACMSLLYLAAQGCMHDQEHITRFWRRMRWDLVLFMLSTNQGLTDMCLMIDLLSTSITPETFGAAATEMTYFEQTNHTLNKIAWHLVETPATLLSIEGEEPAGTTVISENWAESDIYKLRIRLLHLLIAMSRSSFACGILESNDLFIGRLVSLLSDEMDALARIITLGFRLLYHLVTKYENIDMQKKLSVIAGGPQKYILLLSRLHFSEDDLVLESLIEPDIAGLAFELLGLLVTPEEGDAIHDAFSST
ncbi:related to protein UVS-3 (presumed DNA repair and checkpoint control protein) [Rhynchosporium agropyri]|uniref:Related to protein UVS-3 (Presumed DNA repair and checkpoint control protein) n=1 Tax=Rhynchosporium agropyri TaxID=914238 RepID=A0A1E1JYC3_9HELO|nr:related to protein UVS-3 (presumed DNA repair and checkpoint control protein) [Rhynchosporium agropyri]